MKDTVFVTGAAGFIGSYVARTLADSGVRVIGLDRISLAEDTASEWGMTAFVSGHCNRQHLMRASEYGIPTAIIHCAGSGSVSASFENPIFDFQANVGTAIEVLEFARGNERMVPVVMPSSAAVYGAALSFPQREDMPLCPVSPYGVHKVMMEDLCRSYARHFTLPVAIVRLFSVYGNGLRKQLLWDACSKARLGNFSFSGTGEEQRDWLHVTDAARLLVLAIRKASAECPVVNGGTGQGITIKSILMQIGDQWNPPLEPRFSGECRQGDPAHYVADTTRLSRWEFIPQINMAIALSSYIQWFKKEVSL